MAEARESDLPRWDIEHWLKKKCFIYREKGKPAMDCCEQSQDEDPSPEISGRDLKNCSSATKTTAEKNSDAFLESSTSNSCYSCLESFDDMSTDDSFPVPINGVCNQSSFKQSYAFPKEVSNAKARSCGQIRTDSRWNSICTQLLMERLHYSYFQFVLLVFLMGVMTSIIFALDNLSPFLEGILHVMSTCFSRAFKKKGDKPEDPVNDAEFKTKHSLEVFYEGKTNELSNEPSNGSVPNAGKEVDLAQQLSTPLGIPRNELVQISNTVMTQNLKDDQELPDSKTVTNDDTAPNCREADSCEEQSKLPVKCLENADSSPAPCERPVFCFSADPKLQSPASHHPQKKDGKCRIAHGMAEKNSGAPFCFGSSDIKKQISTVTFDSKYFFEIKCPVMDLSSAQNELTKISDEKCSRNSFMSLVEDDVNQKGKINKLSTKPRKDSVPNINKEDRLVRRVLKPIRQNHQLSLPEKSHSGSQMKEALKHEAEVQKALSVSIDKMHEVDSVSIMQSRVTTREFTKIPDAQLLKNGKKGLLQQDQFVGCSATQSKQNLVSQNLNPLEQFKQKDQKKDLPDNEFKNQGDMTKCELKVPKEFTVDGYEITISVRRAESDQVNPMTRKSWVAILQKSAEFLSKYSKSFPLEK